MSQSHIDEFVQIVGNKPSKELGPAILYVNQLNMPDMLKAFDTLNPQQRTRFDEAAFSGVPTDFFPDFVLPETKRVGIKRIKFAFDAISKRSVPANVPPTLYETGQLLQTYTYLSARPPTKNVYISLMSDVCADARLHEHDADRYNTGKIIDQDASYGQAGWDIGIHLGEKQFQTVPSVMTTRCAPTLVKKLGVNAHGQPGEVAVNGVFMDKTNNRVANTPALSLTTLRSHFAPVLEFFRNVIVPEGSLGFYSCLAGRGAEGEAFLKQLSLEIAPRRVIAFTTLGFMAQTKQERKELIGGACIEPGVRDGWSMAEGSEERQVERYFSKGQYKDLKDLPWQSENSPHVKIAHRGAIVHSGPDAN